MDDLDDDLRMAFVDAVRHGRTDLADVAREVGASAATQGLPLHLVLDQVERAYGSGPPDVATLRAVAESWAERTTMGAFDVSCHDPLTSWGSVPHLRSHLDDLYRRAGHRGREVPMSHALVVVELPRRRDVHGLALSLRAVDLAEVVATAFPAHVTTARLSTHRFAVLVEGEDADGVGTTLLARLLDRAFADPPPPRQWVERLPRDADGIGWLLAGLTR